MFDGQRCNSMCDGCYMKLNLNSVRLKKKQHIKDQTRDTEVKTTGCSSPVDMNWSRLTCGVCVALIPNMTLRALTRGWTLWPAILAAIFKNIYFKNCKKMMWFNIEEKGFSSCGGYQGDVIICPFGIIQLKIILHPANQLPVHNIFPRCCRKKKKKVWKLHTQGLRTVRMTWHQIPSKSLRVCVCVYMC